jgi:hypothetical protein
MSRVRSGFRYGFKTFANRLALEVRLEIGLGALDPLIPLGLADHLAVPLVPLTAFHEAAPLAVKHFSEVERDVFSAVTVFDGPRRMIVFNDRHAHRRQANSITHELSHALLQHPPHPAIDNATGCRVWREDIENEATYLAGALLVTESAALNMVRDGVTVEDAATQYGVSEDLIRYRLNMTGARKRMRRAD